MSYKPSTNSRTSLVSSRRVGQERQCTSSLLGYLLPAQFEIMREITTNKENG